MNSRQKIQDNLLSICQMAAAQHGYRPDPASITRFFESIRSTPDKYEPGFLDRAMVAIRALAWIGKAKTVIFSHEQVCVFAELRKAPSDAVEYRVPFESTFIQFSRPYRRKLFDDDAVDSDILGMLVIQKLVDRAEYQKMQNDGTGRLVPLSFSGEHDVFLNGVMVFSQTGDVGGICNISWQSDLVHHDLVGGPGSEVFWRDLAVACIGYINCENVYLEKQGEVPEAVNRKREAKGKSRLEPYYVCRIKGVQHDSHATGTGVKHGIRYDVRGHFRRLDTGKTIWVRPHQRGLQNELYIPKVYKVEKGSKPAFNGKEG